MLSLFLQIICAKGLQILAYRPFSLLGAFCFSRVGTLHVPDPSPLYPLSYSAFCEHYTYFKYFLTSSVHQNYLFVVHILRVLLNEWTANLWALGSFAFLCMCFCFLGGVWFAFFSSLVHILLSCKMLLLDLDSQILPPSSQNVTRVLYFYSSMNLCVRPGHWHKSTI